MMQQSKAGLVQKAKGVGMVVTIGFGWIVFPVCFGRSIVLVTLTTSQGIIISRSTSLVVDVPLGHSEAVY